jgi:hypothetical protein
VIIKVSTRAWLTGAALRETRVTAGHEPNGRSGWWLLIGIIPLIGWIVISLFLATEGERRPNAYGSDPKAVPGEAAVSS